MKLYTIIITSIMVPVSLSSCGREDIRRTNCITYGEQCHAPKETVVVTGPEGRQGNQGVPGERGPTGLPGEQGPTGNPGPSGNDGTSCTVASVPGGATVSCTDGSSSFVSNGTDGTDGVDGQDAPPTDYTVTEVVDPCGDHPTKVDEVLLKLANGQLLVLFVDNSNGKNPRLSVLPPGNYMTSDGTACYFTVDANNQVINEHY
jgi:hypothetical protein